MKTLYEQYTQEIAPKLKAELGKKNMMEVPKLAKVTLNVGLGKHLSDNAFIESVTSSMTRLSGQKPAPTKAKKSIANFKIREGMVIGMKVTLRGKRMYDFLNTLVHITLPRVRDFRGISEKSVDKKGNLTIGIKENIAFPEIKADEVEKMHGLEVTISSTAESKKEGLALYKAIGIPFKK